MKIDRYYVLFKGKGYRTNTKYFNTREKAEKFALKSDTIEIGYIAGGKLHRIELKENFKIMKNKKNKSKTNEAVTSINTPGVKGYAAFVKDSDVLKQRSHLSDIIEKTTGYIMIKEQIRKMIKKELIKRIGIILIVLFTSSCTGTLHITESLHTRTFYEPYYPSYYHTVTYIKPPYNYYYNSYKSNNNHHHHHHKYNNTNKHNNTNNHYGHRKK